MAQEENPGQHAEKFGECRGLEQRKRRALSKAAGVARVAVAAVPGQREGSRLGEDLG